MKLKINQLANNTGQPLHVYQVGDKYVVLGGNQRLRALKGAQSKDDGKRTEWLFWNSK